MKGWDGSSNLPGAILFSFGQAFLRKKRLVLYLPGAILFFLNVFYNERLFLAYRLINDHPGAEIMADVIVQKSKLHGKGVFADRNFRKGSTIIRWDTSIALMDCDARKIPLKNRKYLVRSNGLYILTQSPEKYLNHSCMPNTMEKNHCDIALRYIRKGEELTTDYSIDAPPHIKMKCKCKSSNCKRVI